MTNSEYAAWYAALVSTIALGSDIFGKMNDRARIKVKASFAMLAPSNGSLIHQVILRAVNTGKRPITLTSAGFCLVGDEILIQPYALRGLFPHTLNEGEALDVSYDLPSLGDDLANRKKKIDHVMFRDVNDKIYRSKFEADSKKIRQFLSV